MPRVSRENFFATAFSVLAERGFPSVTAAGLCEQLGVTRGSFYHHFESFDDFIDDLIAYWRRTYTEDFVAQVRRADRPLLEHLRMCVKLAASLPHDAEIGLRAWGSVNPRIDLALHEVDELRIAGLAAALEDHGLTATVAGRYARLSLSALIGAQMTRATVTEEYLDDLMALLQRDIADELASGGKPAKARKATTRR
jgi:AcrR family transcriptional regulator